jgi:hypothetical protein
MLRAELGFHKIYTFRAEFMRVWVARKLARAASMGGWQQIIALTAKVLGQPFHAT